MERWKKRKKICPNPEIQQRNITTSLYTGAMIPSGFVRRSSGFIFLSYVFPDRHAASIDGPGAVKVLLILIALQWRVRHSDTSRRILLLEKIGNHLCNDTIAIESNLFLVPKSRLVLICG